MKGTAKSVGIAAFVGLAMSVGALAAQKNAAPAGKAAANAAAKSEGEQIRRLPHFYDRLALSAEQEKKIAGIQEDYRQKILPLEEQVDKLRAERDKAVREALSSEQREKLDKFIASAPPKRGVGGEREDGSGKQADEPAARRQLSGKNKKQKAQEQQQESKKQ
jgi:hypothetical protein